MRLPSVLLCFVAYGLAGGIAQAQPKSSAPIEAQAPEQGAPKQFGSIDLSTATPQVDFANLLAGKERSFRKAAEGAVRERLIDPDSARFEWPYGFLNGYWKPVLQKRILGNWTCGRVNARNRMGGYAGSSAFVVVLDDQANPLYVEIGTGKDYDFTELGCQKAAKLLPAASPEASESPVSTGGSVSVADELEKLASLRDRGILTQAEFEAQKAELLSKHQ